MQTIKQKADYKIWGIFRVDRMLYDKIKVSTSKDVLHVVWGIKVDKQSKVKI